MCNFFIHILGKSFLSGNPTTIHYTEDPFIIHNCWSSANLGLRLTPIQLHLTPIQLHLTPIQLHLTPLQLHLTPIQLHLTRTPYSAMPHPI